MAISATFTTVPMARSATHVSVFHSYTPSSVPTTSRAPSVATEVIAGPVNARTSSDLSATFTSATRSANATASAPFRVAVAMSTTAAGAACGT